MEEPTSTQPEKPPVLVFITESAMGGMVRVDVDGHFVGLVPEGVETTVVDEGVTDIAGIFRAMAVTNALSSELRSTEEIDERAMRVAGHAFDRSLALVIASVGPALAGEVSHLCRPFGDVVPTKAEAVIAHSQLRSWADSVVQLTNASLQGRLAAQGQGPAA